MTKLMQWLLLLSLYAGIYCAVLKEKLELEDQMRFGVLVVSFVRVSCIIQTLCTDQPPLKGENLEEGVMTNKMRF